MHWEKKGGGKCQKGKGEILGSMKEVLYLGRRCYRI